MSITPQEQISTALQNERFDGEIQGLNPEIIAAVDQRIKELMPAARVNFEGREFEEIESLVEFKQELFNTRFGKLVRFAECEAQHPDSPAPRSALLEWERIAYGNMVAAMRAYLTTGNSGALS